MEHDFMEPILPPNNEQHSSPPIAGASKLLVCVDTSAEAKAALTLTALKAKRRGDVLEMLHVMEPVADVQSLFSVVDRVREERRAEGEALLQELAQWCQDTAGITPSLQLKEGRVGEVILSTVLEDPDVNLLILGAAHSSDGRGKLLGWLAAQLGDKLLVPLMLVPGNLTEQQINALV
jgi:nucleotide-binding universal stress UspA family protein